MLISTEFSLKIKSKSLIQTGILTGNCLLLFSAMVQGHFFNQTSELDTELSEENSF
jgi:hypothetical protein